MTRNNEGEVMTNALYLDDFLSAEINKDEIRRIAAELWKGFEIRELGGAKHC